MGSTDLALLILRSWRLKPSMVLVVSISFLHNLSLAADMVVDGIQEYHSVDGFQGGAAAILWRWALLSVIWLTVLSETDIP